MKQLRLDIDMGPESLDYTPTVKTPDDVYRLELRLTFRPEDGKMLGAVEVTHESSRELVSWKMLPTRTSQHEGEQLAYLGLLWAEARVRFLEMMEPF